MDDERHVAKRLKRERQERRERRELRGEFGRDAPQMPGRVFGEVAWPHRELERLHRHPEIVPEIDQALTVAWRGSDYDFDLLEAWARSRGRSFHATRLLMMLAWWTAMGRDQFGVPRR